MKIINLKNLIFSLKWSLKRIWALFQNEIESLLKDRQSLLIVFLVPLLILIPFHESISGKTEEEFGGRFTISATRSNLLGVLDLDNSTGWANEDLSESFINILSENLSYSLRDVDDRDSGELLLSQGLIGGLLIIPHGFESNVSQHIAATVILVVDATDVEGGANLVASMEVAIAIFKFDHGLIRDEIYPVSFTPFKAQSILVKSGPLIFSILLFAGAVLLSSQSIVGDEPLKRTLLTPAGKLEVIIGKLMAYSG
ncbi:MAG: hypothetical protein ACTSWN_14415, partial [Promethearchaeota archaeon]